MPLIDAGFSSKDGSADNVTLENVGPTIQVTITYAPDGKEIPDNKIKVVDALVDTGATQTCIDNQLAIDLELPVVDVQQIGGAGGISEHNVYMAHVVIPNLDITQYGKFTGVNLSEGEQRHQCLLGRTFLRNTIMIYDGIRAQVSIASTKKT